MAIISHLFIDKGLKGEIDELEDMLFKLQGASKDEAYGALQKRYPQERRKLLRQLMVNDIHLGEERFRDYLTGLLIPRVLMTLEPKEYAEIEFMTTLRIDFSCDECNPTTNRRVFMGQDSTLERLASCYTLERDAFADLMRNKAGSDFYGYCSPHQKHAEIAVSTEFEAPLHLAEYKLHSIRGGLKQGESLMFKLVDRLEDPDPEPIWDLYRLKIVTMTPHDDTCMEKGILDYSLLILRDIYNDILFNMENPLREGYNKRIRERILAERQPEGRAHKAAVEKDLVRNWLVPGSDRRLFDGERIVNIADPDEYVAEQTFDWYHVPIELQLTSWTFEKNHYEGDLQHAAYEKKRAKKAILKWEDYQRGIFKFFIETRFFDRCPRNHPEKVAT